MTEDNFPLRSNVSEQVMNGCTPLEYLPCKIDTFRGTCISNAAESQVHDAKICCMRTVIQRTPFPPVCHLTGAPLLCVGVCGGLINALTSRYNSLLACLDYPIFARILVEILLPSLLAMLRTFYLHWNASISNLEGGDNNRWTASACGACHVLLPT